MDLIPVLACSVLAAAALNILHWRFRSSVSTQSVIAVPGWMNVVWIVATVALALLSLARVLAPAEAGVPSLILIVVVSVTSICCREARRGKPA